MVQRHRYDHGLNGAVAAVIRGERAMADLTIQQLADRAGVNMQTLRRYLATERAFDIETLDDVAQALGLSAADVMVRAQDRLAQTATIPEPDPEPPTSHQSTSQSGRQSSGRDVDAGAKAAVRGNRALRKALDRKASSDTPPSTQGQRDDAKGVNRRRRRA